VGECFHVLFEWNPSIDADVLPSIESYRLPVLRELLEKLESTVAHVRGSAALRKPCPGQRRIRLTFDEPEWDRQLGCQLLGAYSFILVMK
jgi:hypothetical protein